MPDRRTTYITDDGTNVAFYKFVSDNVDDFSSGKGPRALPRGC
jgi:secreted PhoX family phosphatase